MLKEWEGVRQRLDEGRRRWFTDDQFDLILWYDDSDQLLGFQLCYDKPAGERAITWFASGTYSHAKVDDGESKFGTKATAVLVSDGVFDSVAVAERFEAAAGNVEHGIVRLVIERLKEYPGESSESKV